METCNVEYPKSGPAGLNNTASDPKGKTSALTSKWGKKGRIKVTTSRSGQCVAKDPKNPGKGQVKFTYYVPTMLKLSSSLLLDKASFGRRTSNTCWGFCTREWVVGERHVRDTALRSDLT